MLIATSKKNFKDKDGKGTNQVEQASKDEPRIIKLLEVSKREKDDIYDCYFRHSDWGKEESKVKVENDSEADKKSALSAPMT